MSTSRADASGRGRLRVLEGILPIRRDQLPSEILAGITLAALAIPSAMGYTAIAGMPVITGLYTLLLPMMLFALFGSSRHLAVGADSATAAILAAGLADVAVAGSPEYVALAGVLALLVALCLVLARLVRLGFLADFLSHTVLIGFLTGVGIQVAAGQVAGMMGLPGGEEGALRQLTADVQNLSQTNVFTLALSVTVLAVIVGARRLNPKIPGALIAVLGSIAASYVLDLAARGVAVLGPIPGGLPVLALPHASLNVDLIQHLLPTVFSLFIVILAQSAATARAYAARHREHFDENADLFGLGLANIGAGLTGTFVVNGSPTKTQIVDGAGGRSQLAQLTTSAIVLIVLIFLTGPLAYLPKAVLATVVFMIGVELIDLRGLRAIQAERRVEFWLAVSTAAVVVLVGVETGILLAIILSLLLHTRHGYKPKNSVLKVENGRLRPVPLANAVEATGGVVLYRFNHSMYYANADQLAQELLALAGLGPDPVRWICIDLVAVDDVDFTAAATLRDVSAQLAGRGVRLVFANASGHVRKELERSRVTQAANPDLFYGDPQQAVEAYAHANATCAEPHEPHSTR